VLDFSTAYSILIGLNGVGSKKFCSLRSRAYSHPQFQNVTTAVECTALVLTSLGLNPGSNFMMERCGKRKFWVGLTGVLGEGQLHSLAPALVFCPLCPSVCPHAAPKTKSWRRPWMWLGFLSISVAYLRGVLSEQSRQWVTNCDPWSIDPF